MTIEISEFVIDAIADRVAKKIKESKIGRWIRHDNGKYHWYLCSNCDAMAGSDEKMRAWKYCPNCGEKKVEPKESEASE